MRYMPVAGIYRISSIFYRYSNFNIYGVFLNYKTYNDFPTDVKDTYRFIIHMYSTIY